ncbi:efflux RND transporter periplasmic adaptor subunit [Xanthomonas axonopodis pv. poinsettiicola]|uniref:efflux RND transporter periplasmic adaptor subunit n=1 Tax=Xanthomonas TaxID=338 RepID=UPI001E410984|nr:efflux RND transporter periplasmic adaptor subunit [Xanthomonas codiaei]MCC8538553.1 efflux RND transporter periplasmic adaptor subunit [Xanthomonas codiaei]
MKKLVIVAVVLIVGLSLVVLGKSINKEDALPVQVEPAQRATIEQRVRATGKIQSSIQVKISADISARITRLHVKEGDQVEKDQLLVELDNTRRAASLASQEALLNVAQDEARLALAKRKLAESRLERDKLMFARQLVSRDALDSSTSAYEVEAASYSSAVEQIRKATGELEQTNYDLAQTRLFSPISGTVSVLRREAGEIVIGSQFQEDVIMIIADLGQMEATVNVDENDIKKVKIGQPATLSVDALPGAVIVGRVAEVASSARLADQGEVLQKTEYRVKVAITEGGGQVRPGMTVNANILTDTRQSALSVPIQSVTLRPLAQWRQIDSKSVGSKPIVDTDGYVQLVYLVENGRAVARQVKVGIQNEDRIEILDGLKEGENVVSGSYRAITRDLNDGDAVEVTEKGLVADS